MAPSILVNGLLETISLNLAKVFLSPIVRNTPPTGIEKKVKKQKKAA